MSSPGVASPATPGSRRSFTDWLQMILGGVWVLFLAFPIGSLLTSGLPAPLVVAGVVATVLFAGIYLAAMARTFTLAFPLPGLARWALAALLLMVATSGFVAALIGLEALGFLTFFISLGMFMLPVPLNWVVTSGALTASILLPALFDGYPQWIFMILVNLSVFAGVGISRYYAERAETHLRLMKETAVLRERERVARDVHDVLGHSLTVISVKAELAERLLDIDPARARSELREIHALSRSAIAEVRATVGGLRAGRLDEEVAAAVAALEAAGVETEVQGDSETVDPRHRLLFAWVVREAVTNVIRHAHATRCRIVLAPDGLAVEDDGAGLGDAREGNGMRGLRERIADGGASLAVGAGDDGRGTRVEVTA